MTRIKEQKVLNSGISTVKPIIEFKGSNGKIELYENFVRLDRGTFMGVLTQGLKGKKDIYLKNITSVQIKKPGLMPGYMQFSIPGGNESLGGLRSSSSDENTIKFNGSDKYEIALKIKEYIDSYQNMPPKSPNSDADEIEKLHSLLKKGIINQKEFDQKKKKLLGV